MTLAACIQLNAGADIKANLNTTARLLEAAAVAGAKLAVLPEHFATAGIPELERTHHKEKVGDGLLQSFLAQQAQQLGLWIVGGTIPTAVVDNEKIANTCLVFNDKGDIVAHYDKMHLFDVVLSKEEIYFESSRIIPGNEIVVVDTPIGKLGLAVCYDLRFPELFRCFLNRGVEVITLPSAFTVPTGQAHWEVLTRARAIENFCYFLGAGQVGMHPHGRQTYGHSLIVNPWGEVVQCLEQGEGIIVAEIDLEFLRQARQKIPAQSHQKIKCHP